MNRKFIFGPCAIAAGLVLCGIGLWILLSPVEYQATVKIEIEPDTISDVPFMGPGNDYDPYFFETEFKAMVSEVVLSNVVETLNLNTQWGKRYGRTLETTEAIKLLRPQIDLSVRRNTKIVEIRVTDKDPNEAAKIANTIAEAYKDYRIARHKQEMANGIKMLEEDYQKEEARIAAMQAHLEELRKQLNLTNDMSDDVLEAHYPEYYQAKWKLDSKKDVNELLKAKIEAIKKDDVIPKTPRVVCVDPAVPPTAPSGPNRKIGAVLLICGLATSGFGFYSLRKASIRE